MKRRSFFTSLGVTAAALVVAPSLLANEIPKEWAMTVAKELEDDHDLGLKAIVTKCEDGELEVAMFKKGYQLFPGKGYQFFIFGRDFVPHDSSVYGDTTIHSIYTGTAINSQRLKLSDSVFQKNSNIHAGDYLIIRRIINEKSISNSI